MPPQPTDPFDLTILLYREGEHRQVVGRKVTVVLPLSFDFPAAVRTLDESGLLVAENESARQIEFALPQAFFHNLSELMVSSVRRTTPPAGFYLADINYRHGPGVASTPDPVRRFLDAVTVFRLIRQVADHAVEIGGRVELVFLSKEKLVITPDYGTEDLLALETLEELERDFFLNETHCDQKKTILRTVLHELFGARGKVRFADLLASFGEIVSRAKSGYQLYVAEFSFEKIKAEVEKEKAEFTARLNKVFSDIQNQLLAVPAALILVGGQMKNTQLVTISNVMIWLGSLVFALLMDLLIRNQRNTLLAIKHEFDQQWRKMESGKHQAVAENFKEAYQQISRRYDHQHLLLWVIDGLVAASLLFTSALFFWYSSWIAF